MTEDRYAQFDAALTVEELRELSQEYRNTAEWITDPAHQAHCLAQAVYLDKLASER